MTKKEYDFTSICVPKNLLKDLKEIKKEHRIKSYRGLIEKWIDMEKAYKQLRKIKELRQFTKQDIDKAVEFFEKLDIAEKERKVIYNEILKLKLKIIKNET